MYVTRKSEALSQLIPVICKGQNRKEMFLWAKLYCKVPQVSKINDLNSCLTEFSFQKIISKIFIPVNSSLAREREGEGYILPFPLRFYVYKLKVSEFLKVFLSMNMD